MIRRREQLEKLGNQEIWRRSRELAPTQRGGCIDSKEVWLRRFVVATGSVAVFVKIRAERALWFLSGERRAGGRAGNLSGCRHVA